MTSLLSSKWFWISLIGLLILIIPIIYLYNVVSQYDEMSMPKTSNKTAIVLGAALWNDQPSPALLERLWAAVELWNQGKVEKLILTGGLGSGDQQTEAEAMKKFLLSNGIPEEALILEEKATNTYENLLFSSQLIPDEKKVIILTHDYHMQRALLISKQIGLAPVPYPVHSSSLFIPYHKVRECFALIEYYVTGKIS